MHWLAILLFVEVLPVLGWKMVHFWVGKDAWIRKDAVKEAVPTCGTMPRL